MEQMNCHTFKGFSDADDDILCACEPLNFTALATQLGRDEHVVIQRAFQLGLIKYADFNHVLLSHRRDGWRSDELDFLIRHIALPRKKLAALLGRSPLSVSKQINSLGCTRFSVPVWNDVDRIRLTMEFTERGVDGFAQRYERTALDVKYQAVKLGLTRKGQALMKFPGRQKNNQEAA